MNKAKEIDGIQVVVVDGKDRNFDSQIRGRQDAGSFKMDGVRHTIYIKNLTGVNYSGQAKRGRICQSIEDWITHEAKNNHSSWALNISFRDF